MIYSNISSDNSSSFRNNLLERIENLIVTIDDEITVEKVQYDVNREEAKISTI